MYQRSTGGWPANIDMARVLSEKDKAGLGKAKSRKDATLDNRATHTQIRYLARVCDATGLERFQQACLGGVDYLLEAQYANGGWPQASPRKRRPKYSRHITFNDWAMIGAISVLHDIVNKKPSYTFVDEERRKKAEKAVQKGIECILKCQIIVDGKRTAWCQQHDQISFEPKPARSFEPLAITTAESVGIVKFLMSIDNPPPEIIEVVQGAVAWLDCVKLSGIRQVKKPDNSKERGFDRVVVEDEMAPPIWARLVEIGSNRPIFGDRDSKVHYAMSDISSERRTGYTWYGYWPADLLAKDYPAWQKKWAPGKSVVGH
ncbi:MAG: pectate lyase [Planctomycetota bacterium]